jgi:uncharacterized protein (TIRG00374 family)
MHEGVVAIRSHNMTQKKQEANKSPLSFILRIVLSFGLLAWIFSKIDMAHTCSVIQSADLGYLSWAFFVFFLINLVILLRWYILIRALRLDARLGDVIKWFFIGIFCNLFLPSSVGGDVIKIIGLSKVVQQKPKVFASVVLDRLSGFAGIVIVAAIMFVVGYEHIPDRSVGWSIIIMTLVSLSIAAVLFSHRIYSFCCKLFNRWPSIKESLMNVHYDIALMKGKVGEGLLSILLSCLAQLLLAYVYFVVAKALHQDINFLYFLIFSPLICVATALPSIGGLGVREMGWAFLLSKVGVAQGVAVSISLINFLFMVIVGLIGGAMYVLTFLDRRVQSHQTKSGVRK